MGTGGGGTVDRQVLQTGDGFLNFVSEYGQEQAFECDSAVAKWGGGELIPVQS